MARQRLTPEQRKKNIMEAAVLLARADGIDSLTRARVAYEAECAVGLISHYYKPFSMLTEAVERRLMNG